jgi:hypothetical protein
MDDAQIFYRLKVQPTAARKEVLKLIFAKIPGEFTTHDICAKKNEQHIPLSETAVGNIIRLFHVRGLLIQCGEKKCPSRGRPELLFKVSNSFVADI